MLQFQDPAESTPASFRALDVRPGGVELLVGTHRCDLWEINPSTASKAHAHDAASVPADKATSSVTTAPKGYTKIGGGGILPDPLIQGHTGDVYGVAFHPKKPHKFATACESNNVYLWHARRRQLLVSQQCWCRCLQ